MKTGTNVLFLIISKTASWLTAAARVPQTSIYHDFNRGDDDGDDEDGMV